MHFIQKLFVSSSTKLSSELGDVATASLPSPLETSTAVCTTPNQARRVLKTIDGQLLVLCSDDVKYLSVIENMFVNLKLSNGEAPEEQFVHIPISIQSETMYKIIDWSRAAKKTDESKLDFCQFFPNINIKEAIQILEASLFLGLIKLEKCAAKWIASKLEGKSTSEMAQILVVPNAGLNEESQEQLNQFKLVTPPYLD